MFDLGMTEEPNGSFLTLIPEFLVCEANGIEVSEERVGFFCEYLEVSFGVVAAQGAVEAAPGVFLKLLLGDVVARSILDAMRCHSLFDTYIRDDVM